MTIRKKTIRAYPKKMSVLAHSNKTADYETDFSKWANNQAKFLKKGEFLKLDIENLIEEIEDLSKREKQRLTSHLEILLMHMLKSKYQPEMHTVSWDLSIKEANHKAQKTLSENPSLKPKLKGILEDAYFSARIKAALETKLLESTFPTECPWKVEDIFQIEEKIHKPKKKIKK